MSSFSPINAKQGFWERWGFTFFSYVSDQWEVLEILRLFLLMCLNHVLKAKPSHCISGFVLYFLLTTNGLHFEFWWGNCLPLFFFSSNKPPAYGKELRYCISPTFAWSLPLGQANFGSLSRMNASNNVPKISGCFCGFWYTGSCSVELSGLWVECEILGCLQLQRIYLFRL